MTEKQIEQPETRGSAATPLLGLFNAFLDRVDLIAGERLLNWQLAISNEVRTFRELVNAELPVADCQNCVWMKMRGEEEVEAGLHCYMFRDHPGERCGKMKRIGQ